MGPLEIALIIVCVLIVGGVVFASIKRKKQGKCSCDCGGDCAHCAKCVEYLKNKNTNK